jgi:asparagine synthase (glutamine-hydrolysing)
MCGFAGVVAFDDRFAISRDVLQAMSQAVAHRGPDGLGTWFDPDPQNQSPTTRPRVAFAHRRLAIIDPDPRSDQPFADGPLTMIFNGEIYNFRELRQQISAELPSKIWRTSGDTEVLLAAYALWGESCVEKLNGMFALAIWNASDGSLFLARDRLGQTPLYFAPSPGDGAIAVASELAALRAVPWVDAAIDRGGIVQYLRWGYVPAPGTAFRRIFKLPPGCTMLCRAGRFSRPHEYFDPNQRVAASNPPEPSAAASDPVESTRRLLMQSVRRQLVADVPVGCFLSGGIDSSIVAAAMKAAAGSGQEVMTFAIGFDDARYDETAHAAAVARHLGTTHREFRVRPDAAADLPRLARCFGEPFGDSSALPTHYLAQQTRPFVKVALSGDGGDEMFCGYDRYRAMALAQRVARQPIWIRRALASGALQSLPGTHPKSRLARLKRWLASLPSSPAQRYSSYMRLFDDAQIDRLFGRKISGLPGDAIADEFETLSQGRDVVETSLAVDRVTYLPDDLLTKLDRASMLHALEVRSPFLDPDVVTFAAGLHTDNLLGGGSKPLLRRAFAGDLPTEVFRRRKMGFAVPIGDWLRNELRPMVNDLLFSADSVTGGEFDKTAIQDLVDEHQSGRTDHSQRLYALLMLELWRRG